MAKRSSSISGIKHSCDDCENVDSDNCRACMRGAETYFHKQLQKKKEQLNEKNRQIRALKREIRYNILCRMGDIEYVDDGPALMEEFDEQYRF